MSTRRKEKRRLQIILAKQEAGVESMEAGVALVAVVAYVAARGNPLPLLLSWLGDAFALATRVFGI